MKYSRRSFLKNASLGACTIGGTWRINDQSRFLLGSERAPINPLYREGEYQRINSQERVYHISCSLDMFHVNPDFPEIWREAGVTDAWLSTWFYGFFPFSWKEQDYWLERLKKSGIRPHLLCVPFCHGGGALEPRTEGFPNLPPEHWKLAKRWDGRENWGWSWHYPVVTEGSEAIKILYERYGEFDYFLDDDFRFSTAPGDIGGCICDDCRKDFLEKSGLVNGRWNELLDDIRNNRETSLLHAWVDYFCDRMSFCFREWQNVEPRVDVGIMVMYMGCERSGIRLDDYRDALFRVGEGGFSDNWYNSDKTKTIELYSSLFHRRFCEPERAFSETTVFPEKSLSADNMASKLSVSTISDVRNTCFMSGLVPIDERHWPTLSKRMAREKEYHSRLLGKRKWGPFKHFYGLSSRYCAGENAFSLFLALGVPFEVCDEIPKDGWTFLSEPDAAAVERGALFSPGSVLIARVESAASRFHKVSEDFQSLFEFRRSILFQLQKERVPYVEEEIPIVLAWYPDVELCYVWNISQEERIFHIRRGDKLISVRLPALDSMLLELKTLC